MSKKKDFKYTTEIQRETTLNLKSDVLANSCRSSDILAILTSISKPKPELMSIKLSKQKALGLENVYVCLDVENDKILLFFLKIQKLDTVEEYYHSISIV